MPLRTFWHNAAVPLDEAQPGLADELAALRTLCEQRIRTAGSDMNVARAVYEITECLTNLPRARASAESQWKAVEQSKAEAKDRKGAEAAMEKQAGIASAWQQLIARVQTECLSTGLSKVQVAWKQAHLDALHVSEKGTVPAWQWAYAVYWKSWQSERAEAKASAAASATAMATCLTCNGTGLVRCLTCGGMGSVPGKASTTCAQCGGSGSYRLKGSTRAAPCPFCKGSGQIVKDVRQPCSTCEAKGSVACATCGGRGVVLASTQAQQ